MGLDTDKLVHASVCLDNALSAAELRLGDRGPKYWIKKCLDDLNYILMLLEDE